MSSQAPQAPAKRSCVIARLIMDAKPISFPGRSRPDCLVCMRVHPVPPRRGRAGG